MYSTTQCTTLLLCCTMYYFLYNTAKHTISVQYCKIYHFLYTLLPMCHFLYSAVHTKYNVLYSTVKFTTYCKIYNLLYNFAQHNTFCTILHNIPFSVQFCTTYNLSCSTEPCTYLCNCVSVSGLQTFSLSFALIPGILKNNIIIYLIKC